MSSYWRGRTESETEATIEQNVRPGNICYDLGTHFGIYTVGMARKVGPSGRVFGFEPDPVAFGRCRLHIWMNRLTWVDLRNVAVSDTATDRKLIVDRGPGTPFSRLPTKDEEAVRPSAGRRKEISVPAVRLDDLVESGDLLPPDFMKVDVEGHGEQALRGAIKTIRHALPIILIGFHSSWEQQGVRHLLEPLGYQPFDCKNNIIDWLSEYAVLHPMKAA